MEALCLIVMAGVFAAEPAQNQTGIDALIQKINRNSAELRKKSSELEAKFSADRQARKLEEEEGPYSVSSQNFVVGAPSKSLATAVLAKAETYRRKFAIAWFGEEIPEGKEFTLIRVTLSDNKDEGLTLFSGKGRRFSGDHRMWLETSRERAVGSTLAHEITHVILNWKFPNGMPAWANEGIASSVDNPERVAIRQRILQRMARENKWPSVANVLNARGIHPTDETSYAVAISLTQFFLSRGDGASFLEFVTSGSQTSWDAALNRSYRIAGVDELQKQWQTWLARTLRN